MCGAAALWLRDATVTGFLLTVKHMQTSYVTSLFDSSPASEAGCPGSTCQDSLLESLATQISIRLFLQMRVTLNDPSENFKLGSMTVMTFNGHFLSACSLLRRGALKLPSGDFFFKYLYFCGYQHQH